MGPADSEVLDPFEQVTSGLVEDREVSHDPVLVERVAGIDIGKAEVVVCVRVPRGPGRRRQLVRTFATMTRDLLVMADWLAGLGVTQATMEATGDYWRSPYYVLESRGLGPRLVRASDVKHLPGRSKTDVLDAVWLCKLAERGMLQSSFVPPPPIRELRQLTRYRASCVQARTAEKQRVEKLLEDAQIKLSVLASDMFGVSGRAMMQALIGGERDERVLAELARGRMRPKVARLREAFIGRFNDNHAFLLATMLANIDRYEQSIAELEARIEVMVRPFRGSDHLPV